MLTNNANNEQDLSPVMSISENEVFANAFFAYGYAQMVLRYIQDNLNNGLITKQFPIYILDYTPGSGKFSYLFIRKLTDFLQHFKINDCKICYVICDTNADHLPTLQASPFFADFIQQGILDFAHFQEGQKELKLLQQNINLNIAALPNPCVGIANSFNTDLFTNIAVNKALFIAAKQDQIPSTKEQSEELSGQVNSDTIKSEIIGLRRSIENLGGVALLPSEQEEFKVSIFSFGQPFAQLPNTTWAYDHFYIHCSSSEYLRIKDYMINHPESLDLDNTLSLLKFSYWDADVLFGVAKPLAKIINQATPGYINTLKLGLTQAASNYYFADPLKNLPFELGHIYHLIGDLEQAHSCYKISVRDFGESTAVFFNLGLCNYYKHEAKTALECFKKAVALDNANSDAQNWVEHIEKELAN